jgi:hypothetical protein
MFLGLCCKSFGTKTKHAVREVHKSRSHLFIALGAGDMQVDRSEASQAEPKMHHPTLLAAGDMVRNGPIGRLIDSPQLEHHIPCSKSS